MDRKPELAIEIGAVFQGRYKILEQLSRGGFGIVYKAEQLATGQSVALKFLYRRGSTPEEDEKRLARFRREVKLCAQLHHPNIVRLIDSGVTSNEALYAAFEFVPGKNLAQLLAEEGRLTPVEAGHLMGQVLDALSCAHDQGIIHRDLKPANIMVVSTGARRNALVLDFGIGTMSREAQGIEYTNLTATLDRLGTPTYSSPEQLRGRELTPHTDIYSWGLVFLECLTGQRVIQGESLADVMHRQLSEEPVPLPYALKNHPLDDLLRLATAKRLAHRRITARELLDRLGTCDLASLSLPADDSQQVPMQQAEDASTLGLVAADMLAQDMLAPEQFTPVPVGLAREVGTRTSSGRASITSSRLGTGSHPGSWTSGEISVTSTAERRQITVVSCAVSVAALQDHSLDIEEQELLLAEYMAFCGELARGTEGYIASESDDRVVLCFGYPKAHGDDPRRAVRAALAIADAFSRHAGERAPARSIRAQVQIGVHTGLVLVHGSESSRTRPRLAGSTLRLAFQLAHAAEPGTVITSADTHGLVRHHFESVPRDPLHLSSRTQAMKIFQVVGPRRRDLGEEGYGSKSIMLIGRQEELGMLQRHWALARDGRGQAVLVIGDAGIGKSRLVREVGRRIRKERGYHLVCRCNVDSRNSTLYPVVEMLERHLDYGPEVPEAERQRRLEALLTDHGFDLAEAMPLLAPLLSLPPGAGYEAPAISPQRHRELTLNALVSLLLEMAAHEPLLLLVEDVHWADATTLELLIMLLDEVPMTPICIMLTATPEFQPPWYAPSMPVMQVGRLSRDAVVEIVAQLTDGKQLPDEVIDELVQRTDGVPLFVEELTRAVLESSAIQEHGSYYSLRGSLADLAIPAALRDILMARLDQLDDTARAILQIAAVLGREFTYEQLQALVSMDDAMLQMVMSRLVDGGLLYCRRTLSGEIYSFRHALLHDTTCESLPRNVRRRYHAHIAQVLEAQFPEVARNRPDVLAHHHAGAGAVPLAIEYARQAATKALQQSASQEAIGHAEQAIAWLPAITDERERAEMELSCLAIIAPALLGTQGHGSEVFADLARRTEALIAVVGDNPAVLPALWGLWIHRYVRSEHAEAALLAQRYLEHAERLNDTAQQLVACALRSSTMFYMGQLVEARASAEAALAPLDPDMPRPALILMIGHDMEVVQSALLAIILWLMGHTDQATARMERDLALARERDHAVSTCFVLFFSWHLAHWNGEDERGLAMAEEILALGAQFGLDQWLALGEQLAAGSTQDVERGLRALDVLFQDGQGQTIGHAYWLITIAEAELARGDAEQALVHLEEARYFTESTGETYALAEVHRLMAQCLCRTAAPRPDEAEAALRRAVDTARAQNARWWQLRATADLLRLLREQGRGRELEDELRALLDGFTEGRDTLAVREARALLG